ncbi:MAG: radical SAM protein, partial [Aliidongia sp.]
MGVLSASVTRPRHPALHLVSDADRHQLLLADGSRLFEIDQATAEAFTVALEQGDEAVQALLARHGLDMLAPIRDGDQPIEPPIRAISLAVAQKCNLGCSYCYAKGGDFGGPRKNMPLDTALASVELLLSAAKPGERLNLAFLGGEPLANRAVLHEATRQAARMARERELDLGFSITTNGTLVSAADIDLFETYGFAVTVSLDGPRDTHDALRPFKGGAGSFDRIMANITPALARQGR